MILSETASPRSGWTQALVKEWLKVVSDSLVSLIRTPPKFLYVALALSLALPALLASFTMVFENAEKNLLKNLNVTVFLNTEASQNDARALAANMAGNSQIKTTSVSTVTVHGKEIFTISMVPATDLTIEDLTPIVEGLNRHTLIDYVDSDRIVLDSNCVVHRNDGLRDCKIRHRAPALRASDTQSIGRKPCVSNETCYLSRSDFIGARGDCCNHPRLGAAKYRSVFG